jgi:hypothetical protein
MAVDIESVLSGRTLVGTIQAIKDGVPEDILPPAWTRVTKRFQGNTGTYIKVTSTRQVARLVQYGSPSIQRGIIGAAEVPVKCLHTFENQVLNPSVLIQLFDPNTNEKDNKGIWEVRRQTQEFKRYFSNLRISSVYSALVKGAINFDVGGNLLPSSSGASTIINFGVPAGNQSQLNVFGAGNLITAKWNSASTLILAQLADIQKAARKLTGYPITTAFFGANIRDYIAQNTQCAALILANNRYQDAIITGGIASGFGGIKNWIPLYEAFFVDASGNYQDWMSDDCIIFTPDPTSDWWEFIEGSFLVPTNLNLSSDGVAALGDLKEVNGMFSYADIIKNPPTIQQFAGDTFLPLLKVPGAIFIAQVVW